MTTTTSHKLSSLKRKTSLLTLVLLVVVVGGILFAAPSSAMAQQQTTTTTATAQPTTIPPLTPEEQQQQDRLQNTIAATTRNLEQGQKEVDGVVYTPRWSSPVWVEPNNSLSILFVYCLPGEFADAGQEILGGSELEVLESYSLAVTNDLTVWLMVVENENQTSRVPAAVGVICASDLNDAETRILSPQEQTEINNIFQQFITIRNIQITNITQVINIINNVTTNGTGTTTPTNDTGGNDTGGPIIPPPTNGTGGEEQRQCLLEITTDEETYESGDTVTITVTNHGDETLEFSNSVLGLEIQNVDTDEMYPLISAQVITTLEPGESNASGFTYEELVSEIDTGTIEARVGGECSASTTFTLAEGSSSSIEELDREEGLGINETVTPAL